MSAPRPIAEVAGRLRPLAPAERVRFHRQMLLPGFGAEGQARLLASRVLIVGLGGLGCPAAQYLAAAGVGTLGIVDADHVEVSNLHRQILYGPADVGRPKVEVARDRILAINPDVKVALYAERLGSENARSILDDYDVIVDGSDNFPTRYLVSDACVLMRKPNVYGAIFRFDGQAAVFDASVGPCYRCLHPEPPGPGQAPSCAEAGVLGVLPGLIAMVQATEALKLLSGVGESLAGRLLHYDALEMRFTEFLLARDPECPACGERPTVTELIDYEAFCGAGAAQAPGAGVREVTAAEVRALQQRGEEFLLLDVREPLEAETARIVGARLVPLGQLEQRLGEIAAWKARHVVVHCHHGGRSARACELMQRHGFENVENLKGGIDAWSQAVDPSVPRY
ncbi:MAG: molybdopterin-synthase adenylyltransferase MoeB [Deltaproteobacteria bacterium]|nr:molybdopterin-synthase adenylyltransferase MoeB [Deltaproteobacteria bacterium]